MLAFCPGPASRVPRQRALSIPQPRGQYAEEQAHVGHDAGGFHAAAVGQFGDDGGIDVHAHQAELVRSGHVQALLAGNALAVHDMEADLFGTSLGVDLRRGAGVRGGHRHHLRTINRIRAAGSIANAVREGIVRDGVMAECVRADIPYVLAGSIRDDGPLPETQMDLLAAQAAYAQQIEGADLILMLATMLHAIGVGNMTPAGVRLVCVDINPAVVTKLADRGSVESTGIVTDVGLFLGILAARLRD